MRYIRSSKDKADMEKKTEGLCLKQAQPSLSLIEQRTKSIHLRQMFPVGSSLFQQSSSDGPMLWPDISLNGKLATCRIWKETVYLILQEKVLPFKYATRWQLVLLNKIEKSCTSLSWATEMPSPDGITVAVNGQVAARFDLIVLTQMAACGHFVGEGLVWEWPSG